MTLFEKICNEVDIKKNYMNYVIVFLKKTQNVGTILLQDEFLDKKHINHIINEYVKHEANSFYIVQILPHYMKDHNFDFTTANAFYSYANSKLRNLNMIDWIVYDKDGIRKEQLTELYKNNNLSMIDSKSAFKIIQNNKDVYELKSINKKLSNEEKKVVAKCLDFDLNEDQIVFIQQNYLVEKGEKKYDISDDLIYFAFRGIKLDYLKMIVDEYNYGNKSLADIQSLRRDISNSLFAVTHGLNKCSFQYFLNMIRYPRYQKNENMYFVPMIATELALERPKGTLGEDEGFAKTSEAENYRHQNYSIKQCVVRTTFFQYILKLEKMGVFKDKNPQDYLYIRTFKEKQIVQRVQAALNGIVKHYLNDPANEEEKNIKKEIEQYVITLNDRFKEEISIGWTNKYNQTK